MKHLRPLLVRLLLLSCLITFSQQMLAQRCGVERWSVLLQIGFIFSAGMGWEKIVSTSVGK
jgi:hypothetical protein